MTKRWPRVVTRWLALAAAAIVASAQAQPAPDPTDIQVPTVAQLSALCDGCVWVQQVRVDTPKKASAVKAAATLVVSGLLGTPMASASGAAAGAAEPAASAAARTPAVAWEAVLVGKDGAVRRLTLPEDPQLRPGDVGRVADGRLLRP